MEGNGKTHSDLLQLKQKLQEKCEYYKKQLEEFQDNLRSVTATLELLEGKKLKGDNEELRIQASDLQGLSQKEALRKIARAYGGKLRMKIAKRLMIEAGLIENPKNASNILYTTLKRDDDFHNADYGVWEFVEKKPSLLANAG
jgi:hypothetical protein